MMGALKERFGKLTPKQKKMVVLLGIGGLLVALIAGIMGKKQETAEIAAERASTTGPRQIRLDPDLLRRSAFAQSQRELEQMRGTLTDLQKELEEMKRSGPSMGMPGAPAPNAGYGVSPSSTTFAPEPVEESSGVPVPPPPPPGLANLDDLPPPPGAAGPAGGPTFPPPPGSDTASLSQGPGAPPLPPLPMVPAPMAPPPDPSIRKPGDPGTPPAPPEEVSATPQMVGGIANFPNSRASAAAADEAEKKKDQGKGEQKVYLPPSIIQAKLLTGLDASTTSAGKGNPEPVLLRIQAPAILPNSVRANLRGCWIIAEGTGRLDKERIDIRLLSLNCLDLAGHAVIDEKIKGFVTDQDGKLGLSGHVVAKMGAAMARATIAGVIQGAGEALSTSATDTQTSALGTVETINTDEISRSALGQGVSKGIQPIVDLYTDLAKQSAPVIEKLPGTDVTAITTEGVDLKIKTYERLGDSL